MRLNPCDKWLVRTYFDLVSEGGGGGFLISPAILRNPLRPWDLCTAVRLLIDRISYTGGYKALPIAHSYTSPNAEGWGGCGGLSR
jgi:hypothetical protein